MIYKPHYSGKRILRPILFLDRIRAVVSRNRNLVVIIDTVMQIFSLKNDKTTVY